METPTYAQVFAFAGEVEQTGSYSRADMEAILSARFLYHQDWLEHLRDQGPSVLASLRASKQVGTPTRLRFRRAAFLLRSLFSWLMGGEFDEAHTIVRDILENLYPSSVK